MGLGLSLTADSRLIAFNTLALRYQDEAYTLAYYLLGDETSAEKATQAAFDSLYRQGFARRGPGEFRLDVLRQVIAACKKEFSHPVPRTGTPASPEAFLGRLPCLKDGERGAAVLGAVLLVDVLGLDYEEAAQVLGSTRKQVGKLLAQARMSLSAETANSQQLAANS